MVPDGPKPLAEPMLNNLLHFFHFLAISQEIKICILDVSLKINNFILQRHLSGANELNRHPNVSQLCPFPSPYIGTYVSCHYSDVMMSAMASQITGVSIVYSTVCSGADQRKTSKRRVTVLCEVNSPVTAGFPLRRASEMHVVIIIRYVSVASL